MPVHTPPRMPDIWRGYVAMRCLWAMDKGFVFHAPEVFQERNEHDLMKDFRDEMDGYPVYERLCGEIEALDLDKDPAAIRTYTLNHPSLPDERVLCKRVWE